MKLLYCFPAFLYGGLIATIGFTLGFEAFQPQAWLYLVLLVASGVLLSMKKWWGAVPGMALGGILIYLFETSRVHHHINETPIGLGIIAYFTAMGFICYRLTRLK